MQNPHDFLSLLVTRLAGDAAPLLLKLLVSAYSWRDIHPCITLIHVLEADPQAALVHARLAAALRALYAGLAQLKTWFLDIDEWVRETCPHTAR